MEIFIWAMIVSIFWYFNLQILLSDFTEKKIPNKHITGLILLLPLWYVYNIFYIEYVDVWLWTLIWKILVSMFISFWLYYYRVWGAWDSKYFFVLTLFLAKIDHLIFLWNIAIVTFWVMILYLLYFVFIKLTFYKKFRDDVFWIIKDDYSKFQASIIKKSESIIQIFHLILGLTIIYIALRFFKIIVINFTYLPNIQDIWIKYTEHIIIFILIFFIFLIYIIKYTSTYIFRKLDNKWFNTHIIKSFCLYFFSLLLFIIIVFQLKNNTQETKNILFLLFTSYLVLYAWVICWKYFFTLTFHSSEKASIKIDNLKTGMIIDQHHIEHLFRWREVLADDMEYNFKTKVLDLQSIQALKKTIKYINLSIEKNRKDEKPITDIVVIKTISYWIFIYTGFIGTMIFWNTIIKKILDLLQLLFI